MMNKPKIKVDIVSDVVCPWCYIGKRRLEKAIGKLASEYDFELEYHPFELNPQMPETGANQRAYLAAKFGSDERYEQITHQTTQTAATEGLAFAFDKQQVSPNTRKAHVLIQQARTAGKQLEVTEGFFKAYFVEGIDLSKDENLVSVAAQAGLPRTLAEEALADENAPLQVSLAEQEMYKLGITGVPFYIINNRYGVSGAQAAETFVEAFREIVQSKETDVTNSGEACDIDGANC
jgi:predicted DsbA family dithiol-disulfide isomerase